MSTDREQLIAKARAAIKPSDSIELVRAFEHLAFEKAHTPSDTTIPLYAMLDLHAALYGVDADFDAFYREHGYGEAWARLLDAVRRGAHTPTGDEWADDDWADDESEPEQTCAACGRDDVLTESLPYDDNGVGGVVCWGCAAVGVVRRTVQGEPSPDVQALLADADALVESWDRKGSWSADSPVGMVMQLARALRPGVVSVQGEPEWEYGIRPLDDEVPLSVSPMPTYEAARVRADNIRGGWAIVRRRPAGPWVPVQAPEGEEKR